MKRAVIVGLLYTLPVFVLAQNKIETDRPTESQSAELVTKGALQAEVGFRVEKDNENRHTYQHPNAVFRYGLLNRVELRVSADLETQQSTSSVKSSHGLKPIELGLKINLLQTSDCSFTTSLYGHFGVPTFASKSYQEKKTFYRIRLLMQSKLAKKWILTYNIGSDWNDEEKEQNWLYALSPQYELSDKWLTFFESYGTIQKGSYPEHYIDGGIAYNVSRHARLDVAVGKGLNSQASKYFLTTGFSFKL